MFSYEKFKKGVIEYIKIRTVYGLKFINDMLNEAKEIKRKSYDIESGAFDIKKFFALVIGAIFVSALLPAAMSSVNTANTSGWTTSQIALWGIIGVVIIIVVVMMFIDFK